jgi:peptidoglycan hydrolase CwlO-like protein
MEMAIKAEIRTNQAETDTDQAEMEANQEKMDAHLWEMRVSQQHLKEEMRAGQRTPVQRNAGQVSCPS